jgi:hypothetical protein
MAAFLTRAAYERARAFVEARGRDLDKAMLRHGFDKADAERVLDSLATYQNADGGFGHGLEPDLTTPASTAIVTSVGLQLLRQLGAPADHPMVRAAIGWLGATFDWDRGVWPIITPDVGLTPHAFWWNWDEDLAARWNGFRFNPSAELLGDLYAYRSVAPAAVIARAEAALLEALSAADRLDGAYDIKALMRLLETDETPSAVRAPAEALMQATRAAFDPEDPHASPLDLVPRVRPGASPPVADLVEASLATMIDGQAEDGGWAPFWDWSAVDAQAWRAAEVAWRGVLTRQALETLHAYGRIEGLAV